MPTDITTPFTVSRDGSNVIVTFEQNGSGQKRIVFRSETLLIEEFQNQELVAFGNTELVLNLDWTLSLAPIATDITDFIKKLSTISKDTDSRRTVTNEQISNNVNVITQLDFVNVINPRIVNTTITGSASIGITNSMINLSTGVTEGSALATSVRFIKYRPGRGVEIRFSALFCTGVLGTTQLIGAFNETDGVAFGYNGVSFGVLHRNNNVDNWIYENNWNIDKGDGTGILPVLDKQKLNLYQIEFLWYGAGQLKYSLYDPVTSINERVHEIEYANINTIPNLNNPSLNLALFVNNGSTNTDIKIFSSVLSGSIQGPVIILGFSNSFTNSVIGVSTSLVNIFTLRSKTTFGVNRNRVESLLRRISAASDGNGLPTIQLYEDATITSPSYIDIETGSSLIEVDTVGTNPTGGRLLYVFTLGSTDSFAENIESLDIRFVPGRTYTFAASTASSSSTVSIAASWVEDL